MRVGSWIEKGKTRFRVWAPKASSVDVCKENGSLIVSMAPEKKGYYSALVDQDLQGADYLYRLNGTSLYPDPASKFQPHGVHSASRVVDIDFQWQNHDKPTPPPDNWVIYELHVGSFSPDGTFDAVMPSLSHLRSIGINAIELMPVAAFPGRFGWGYDGVYPYAVYAGYGGPAGLFRLIDAAHKVGIAIILDVVYNHLGPEGNYFSQFAPYFSDNYRTPWGAAINFDGPDSDEVRNFFIENALYWLDYFHIDALRLDAIHGIYDFSARPFLLELSNQVREFSQNSGRRKYLIAESDLNDRRVLRPESRGGLGIDMQWLDDWHHSTHTLLTGEKRGYYADFGTIEQLVDAFKYGFVYRGQYSPFRKRKHGNDSSEIDPSRFVTFIQNHDQIGNRPFGRRITDLCDFESAKLAAGLLLSSPYTPLIFMGEEYAASQPFLFFSDYGDEHLRKAVREGRAREFEDMMQGHTMPDPGNIESFRQCILIDSEREKPLHSKMLALYKALIHFRKNNPLLKKRGEISFGRNYLIRRIKNKNTGLLLLFNFSKKTNNLETSKIIGTWQLILDSSDTPWGGQDSALPPIIEENTTLSMTPHSFAFYQQQS